MGWKPIETARKDGTVLTVAAQSNFGKFNGFPFPIRAAFINGKWMWEEKGKFTSFEPQPTHWFEGE